MYCSLCGNKIESNAAFCQACGAPNTQDAASSAFSKQPPVNAAAPSYAAAPYAANNSYGTPDWHTSPQDVSPYYAMEFSKISTGMNSNMNPSAFFLGPFHLLYRGCTQRFLKTFLPIWIASMALCACLFGICFTAIVNPAASTVTNTLVVFFPIVLWITVLINIFVSVWNANTINRYLYHKMQGNPAVPKRVAPTVVAILVVVAVQIISLIGFALLISNAIPEIGRTPEIAADEPYSAEHYGDVVGTILYDYNDITYDQVYTNGYYNEDASLTQPAQTMLNQSYLFYSDVIALGDLFEQASDSYEWIVEETEEGYMLHTAKLLMDDTVLQFSFGANEGLIWLNSALCYLEYDDDADSFYEFTSDEACALIRAFYDQNTTPDPPALAYIVRGTWEAENGSELVIDAELFGEESYTLVTLKDSLLALWLDDIAGPEGDYYLSVSPDMNTLTVLQTGTSDTGAQSAPQVINTYTRIDF